MTSLSVIQNLPTPRMTAQSGKVSVNFSGKAPMAVASKAAGKDTFSLRFGASSSSSSSSGVESLVAHLAPAEEPPPDPYVVASLAQQAHSIASGAHNRLDNMTGAVARANNRSRRRGTRNTAEIRDLRLQVAALQRAVADANTRAIQAEGIAHAAKCRAEQAEDVVKEAETNVNRPPGIRRMGRVFRQACFGPSPEKP